MDAMARNPPVQNTPSIIYGTMDTLLAVGAAGAFSNRPSNVFGIERDAKTPTSYNYSIGVQREMGWGTVLDVTYAGFQMQHAEMSGNINPVPDGARYVDCIPRTPTRRTPTTAKPAEFLRPYLGYQEITMRNHFGNATNNSLQVQLNRRYINGLQFAVAYTLAKTTEQRHRLHPVASAARLERRAGRDHAAAQPGPELHLGRAERQPDVEQRVHARPARRVAGIRRHGLRQRRLGWRDASPPPTTSTSPAARAGRGDVGGAIGPCGRRSLAIRSVTATAIRRRAGRALPDVSTPSAGRRAVATTATRRAPSSGCRRSCCRTSPLFKNFRIGGGAGCSSDGRCTTCSTR